MSDEQLKDTREVRLQDMRQVKIQPVRQRARFKRRQNKFRRIWSSSQVDGEELSPEKKARFIKARNKDRFIATIVISSLLVGIVVYAIYALR